MNNIKWHKLTNQINEINSVRHHPMISVFIFEVGGHIDLILTPVVIIFKTLNEEIYYGLEKNRLSTR